MILYTLTCDGGHSFESWFRDSGAFEDQVAAGHVSCPACRSARVAKGIMAPAVIGARATPASDSACVPASVPPEQASGNGALLDERSRELRALVRQVRQKVIAEGHNVGRQFAAEARRIHDGDAPVRQIYGEASPGEAHDLLEDGIMILPLPIVPDELN